MQTAWIYSAHLPARVEKTGSISNKISSLLFYCVFSFVSVICVAQEDSFTPTGEKAENTQIVPNPAANKIMLIPFESRLYRSDMDRGIARKTNLTYFQIRDSIRYAINAAIHAETESKAQSVSMLNPGDAFKSKDLEYIYNSIGYTYASDRQSESRGSSTRGGEIKTTASKAKFDTPSVELLVFNPNLFAYLSGRYDAEIFLFITEFSVTIEAGTDQYDLANNLYYRTARVNYSIFDSEGKNLTSGVEMARIPSTVEDLRTLIAEYFPLMAKAVVEEIPSRAFRSLK